MTQTALAMDNREAADVLVDRSARSASGLVSIANGWPAVIGLASVSAAEFEGTADPVPESLYRYFADEVFSALGREVQQGLTTLSVAPVLDRELVNALLGLDEAEEITARALDVGILVDRSSQLDVHPLARAFLVEKAGQLGLVPADDAGATCLAHYRSRPDWDAAFELIVRFGWARELEALLMAASTTSSRVRVCRRSSAGATSRSTPISTRLSSRWRARKCYCAKAATCRRSHMLGRQRRVRATTLIAPSRYRAVQRILRLAKRKRSTSIDEQATQRETRSNDVTRVGVSSVA